MQHTTIVLADTNTSNLQQFVSAFSGSAMAEYWRENESHSLVIYDSIQEHAAAYLQMLGKEARPRLSCIYMIWHEITSKIFTHSYLKRVVNSHLTKEVDL
jgi:hypothetical protein